MFCRFIVPIAFALLTASPAAAAPNDFGAQIDEGTCEGLIGVRGPLPTPQLRVMAAACQNAAHFHNARAATLTGAPKQDQQLKAARYLFFAAYGLGGSNDRPAGFAALNRSLAIFHDVSAHAATPDLHERAQAGASQVTRTIAALRKLK